MLAFNAINVWFGNHQVLNNVSCQVNPGDFIVIVGANGAGKTTFFDTIAGNILPTSGTITLDGTDITKQTERQRSSLITRIFQNTRLNCVGSMTVAQNLAIARYSRRYARLTDGMNTLSHETATTLVKQLGMDQSILTQKMSSLSGGQRQLIAFAMATQLIPKLLLLDEPTAALDPQAATTLLLHATEFIKKNKVTTLLITHDPHIALSVGNKIWILDNGTIAQQFNSAEKQTLNPDKLIGQIDYRLLASRAQ